jgi:hypothetical protein
MSEEKNEEKKPQETLEEFCKRLGIHYNTRQGGVEFSPYHGGNHSIKKPAKRST